MSDEVTSLSFYAVLKSTLLNDTQRRKSNENAFTDVDYLEIDLRGR
jgi:hypothetical protein